MSTFFDDECVKSMNEILTIDDKTEQDKRITIWAFRQAGLACINDPKNIFDFARELIQTLFPNQ